MPGKVLRAMSQSDHRENQGRAWKQGPGEEMAYAIVHIRDEKPLRQGNGDGSSICPNSVHIDPGVLWPSSAPQLPQLHGYQHSGSVCPYPAAPMSSKVLFIAELCLYCRALRQLGSSSSIFVPYYKERAHCPEFRTNAHLICYKIRQPECRQITPFPPPHGN